MMELRDDLPVLRAKFVFLIAEAQIMYDGDVRIPHRGKYYISGRHGVLRWDIDWHAFRHFERKHNKRGVRLSHIDKQHKQANHAAFWDSEEDMLRCFFDWWRTQNG